MAWEVVGEDGSMAAERAAQILEERFLQWDRNEQDGRRQVFTEQVQEIYTEQAQEWYRLSRMPDPQSEEWVEDCVVYIGNLAVGVTEKNLGDTFRQIGTVLGAGFAGAGCGWVKFQKAEDAVEAVERFDGVVCVKQAMMCGNSESVWAAQAEDYSLLIRHLRKQVW